MTLKYVHFFNKMAWQSQELLKELKDFKEKGLHMSWN